MKEVNRIKKFSKNVYIDKETSVNSANVGNRKREPRREDLRSARSYKRDRFRILSDAGGWCAASIYTYVRIHRRLSWGRVAILSRLD